MASKGSTQTNKNTSTPIIVINFVRTFSVLNDHQIQCILNIIDTKQTKIIIESLHNLLYNKSIQLSKIEKAKLKKYSDFYILIANRKSTLKTAKTLIARNYKAIKLAFTILLNGRI